jgi:hypothetical protein
MLPSRPKRTRLLIAIVLIAGLPMLWLGWDAWLRPEPLAWARARGWRSSPIRPTRLEQTKLRSLFEGGAWRNLPFDLADDEEAALRRCIKLAHSANFTSNGVRGADFLKEEVRDELEAILQERPDLFYAEYLLGLWHRLRGEPVPALRREESAYFHAPVVLVQRYEDPDGRPLVGAKIDTFAIEHNRVRDHSLDSFDLPFLDLVTDEDGSIYLPAYRTVYRTDSMASPDGYDLTYPRLGFFQTSAKVGRLPPIVVRPEANGDAKERSLPASP